MNEFIDPSKARSDEMYRHYCNIEASGLCPFCRVNFDTFNDPNNIIYENDSWYSMINYSAYRGANEHLLYIPKNHITKLSEITGELQADFFEGINTLLEEYRIASGGLAMRFGNFSHNAASVAHLHVHLIENEEPKSVSFKI